MVLSFDFSDTTLQHLSSSETRKLALVLFQDKAFLFLLYFKPQSLSFRGLQDLIASIYQSSPCQKCCLPFKKLFIFKNYFWHFNLHCFLSLEHSFSKHLLKLLINLSWVFLLVLLLSISPCCRVVLQSSADCSCHMLIHLNK